MKKALNARCGGCGNIFLIAVLPMPLEKAAQLMKRAGCPSCGETKRIFAAASTPIDESGQSAGFEPVDNSVDNGEN
ncbi:hypothetical protein [Rhizobium sp.]|uniref:hypothetical protein n=1 Tax=Rhizobium sp. TaxID=391 RepID=UPI0028A780A7